MDPSFKSEKLLDQIGWKLLHELQLNGRLSYAELGRRVGLTTPAVVERVKRMEEAGIIVGYHADIDPMKVGMPITAFIRMSVVGDVFAKITNVVKSSPEIVECHRGTGADSFIMKVHVRSVEHLEALIDRLTPCGTTSTSIVLSSPVEKREIAKPEEAMAAIATIPQRRQASS
jgi:Lrp/AsnC family transcriptional regulator, leucine-responsive regulatory protein